MISIENLPISPPEYDKEQLIVWENEYMQGIVTFPSWALYQKLIEQEGIARGSELRLHVGKLISLFGQKVTMKRVYTKNKEEMCFVSFSDDTALYETVFFPQVYTCFQDLLVLGGAFILEGVVQEEYGSYQVDIRNLKKI